MTRHKHAQTGLVTPSLPQHWLTATLRMLAMLVLNVASTLQMIYRREAVNGTQPTPTDLPKAKTDTQSQKANNAAQQSSPTMRHTPACHPGSAKRYPGPIAQVGRASQWFPALRFAAAGMTTVGASQSVQRVRSLNNAPPSLRVRRFASNPRRKSGPRASWVMRTQGPPKQPWTPTCAGTSGDLITCSNKNAAV